MSRMQKTIRVFAFLVLVFILVGCSGPTVVAPPTPDIPAIRTESAQTVVAKLTIEAALNPTATAAPPEVAEEPAVVTATAEPSPTAAPATATLAATATLIPTNAPAASGPYPTRTRRAGPDQAQLLSQEPSDGQVYSPGNEFDAKWTFKNIGTSTWTVNYDYRNSSGVQLAKTKLYSLPKEVKPGESVSLIADMVAPSDAGRHVSYWELTNDNGDVFYSFYVVIDVK